LAQESYVTRLPALAALLISLPTLGPWQPPSPEPGDAKTWVGRYQEMEDYLRTAECVSIVASAPDSAARCTFRPGGPVARMAWRSLPPGVHRGFRQSYKSEIAAYELDKLLKMDMVPPSVERRLKGNTGAAQQWVENVVDATDPAVPSGADRTHWDDQLVRMAMFDNLIGNRERNRRNMLRDAEWNLILIDHSRAFGTDTGLHHKMSRIDAAYWAKIEGLTRNQLDAALHGWLDQPEIQAILDRRETMRGEIRLLPK
jgi:hypothetical protein